MAVLNIKEIKKRMIDESVTASHLASAVGVTSSTMYRILKGQQMPDLDAAEAMQALLKIHDEDFCYYFMSHTERLA